MVSLTEIETLSKTEYFSLNWAVKMFKSFLKRQLEPQQLFLQEIKLHSSSPMGHWSLYLSKNKIKISTVIKFKIKITKYIFKLLNHKYDWQPYNKWISVNSL